LLYEIIDTSVDEIINAFGSRITVTLHGDGSASVADDARGIPVEWKAETGMRLGQTQRIEVWGDCR
jgi:DNA gyrase subunit B